MGRRREKLSALPETPPAASTVPRIGEVYTGVFQSTSDRGGFVVLESPGLDDVFIPAALTESALHGDKVRVRILRHRYEKAAEAEIERVLEHANKLIVGQIQRSGKISVVTPKNPKIRRLVEIQRRFSQEEVPDRAWVIVEIQRWSDFPGGPLVGKLKEVLGTEMDRRLPILLLIREGGIQPEFPSEVESEAAEIRKRAINAKEIDRRRDFRSGLVMTIDPITAKDFDDAISLVEKRKDGWRIAVHIADVGHFVTSGSKIDMEAYDRATSIYPVDRVIPMLPEALSNDLCSLRPDEEKLTMTAIFNVATHGEVSGVELCESIIRSARRFSYEEVQGLLDEADGVESTKYPRPVVADELRAELLEIRKASQALLKKRMKRGALDLALPETEILFDAEGLVANLRRKETFESHRLIEDLMIAANEAVARELTERFPFLLYRVHEPPTEEAMLKLTPALGRFGIEVPRSGGFSQEQLQAAIMKARQHPAGAIVQRLVLRSLKRAHYQPGNVGHFGLASPCYCHFTSPIRRYPDLIVHRAVKHLLNSPDAKGDSAERTAERLVEWGRHSSQREERSQKIEWDAQKILSFEFMRRFLGDVFDGHISGLINRGFWVELIDYPVEGFVPIRSIEDDYYDLDNEGMAFHGRNTGRAYALGDRVTVQIERIDVLGGEMDLHLVKKEGKPGQKAPKSGGPKGKGRGRQKQQPWRPPKSKQTRRGRRG